MLSTLTTIGGVELVNLPAVKASGIPARIDTGARTSALWVSSISESKGRLSYTLFDKTSPYYTGEVIETSQHHTKKVTSSNGISETRYAVKLSVEINGRRIKATFTLANRSRQTYPILIGRNILRGKFIVDIKQGKIIRP